MPVLNNLLKYKDIERDSFDFKSKDLGDLTLAVCAMANNITGILCLGVKDPESDRPIDVFRKDGYRNGTQDDTLHSIYQYVAKVDPLPKVSYKILVDEAEDNHFYVILNVEGRESQRPYIIKDKGQIYVRIGSSSTPASRTTIANLFINMLERKNSVIKLRASCRDLIEQIRYTSKDIETVDPREGSNVIKPLNLFFLQNSVLNAEWFFLKNDLFGGHINENSNVEGYYSFYDKLERLNLAINTFNQAIDPFNIEFFLKQRHDIKNDKMKYWNPLGSDTTNAISFLDHIIALCNEFENTA